MDHLLLDIRVFWFLAIIINKAARSIHIHVFLFLNTSFHRSRINAQEYLVLGLIEMAVTLKSSKLVSTVATPAMFYIHVFWLEYISILHNGHEAEKHFVSSSRVGWYKRKNRTVCPLPAGEMPEILDFK